MYPPHPAVGGELLRDERGVPAYLEFQGRLNADAFHTFRPFLEHLGSDAVQLTHSVLEMARAATACEIRVRERERFALARRRAAPPKLGDYATYLNLQAVGHARRAAEAAGRLAFEDAFAAAFQSDDLRALLQETREDFARQLAAYNFTRTEDFGEVLDVWDELAGVALDQGAAGLQKRLRELLAEFAERRLTDERGTSPASPLPWWKYVVIASILALTIFAVVACFVWFKCAWIKVLIEAAGPITKVVFGIVDRGC